MWVMLLQFIVCFFGVCFCTALGGCACRVEKHYIVTFFFLLLFSFFLLLFVRVRSGYSLWSQC